MRGVSECRCSFETGRTSGAGEMPAMKTLRFFIAVFVAAAIGAAMPTAAHAAPVAAEDLFKLTFLDGAQISPDGKEVALVRKRMNGPKNTYDTTVLLVDVATGHAADITHGTQDGDLAWSPDSKSLYFVRPDKQKHGQIFRYALSDGKIVQLSKLKDGASGPSPSHDGKRIAFSVTETDPAPRAYVDFAKAGFQPSKSELKSDIRTITTMQFTLNGAGYVYDKHTHIWVMDADGSNAHAITSGHYSENFGGWSHDDATIVFNSTRYDPVDAGPTDIYTIPSQGGPMRKLASDLPVNFAFLISKKSDDLWYGAAGVEDPATIPEIRTSKFDGSQMRVVVAKNTTAFGDSLLGDLKEGGGGCGDILPDGRTAIVNADGQGYANLRRFDLETGSVSDLTPPRGEAWSCTLSLDGKRVAYLYSDFTHPVDLYVADTASGTARRLTGLNDSYLSGVTLSKPEAFTVKDSAGFTVHAWFMPAAGAAGTKHPTLLDIHGGPLAQFGDTYFDEFQMWTSLGYNVVFSDPRGSSGFGYPFAAALTKDYGNAMFEDVQLVMDEAIKRPDVDASRLGVTGGSYGGFSTLWVVSHTDRYKTAIAERVVSDLQSESFGADFASKNGLGGFYQWGVPWDPKSLYESMSPLTYVNDVHTPLIILHSSEDTRTPVDNTVQEYNLLKILGRNVTYIDVPGENHDLNRTGAPIHRVERLHIMANWFQNYLHP